MMCLGCDVMDYCARCGEKLVEDAEISPTEAGFMEGAEDDGEQGKCANCGAALLDAEHTVETKIEGKGIWFCSDACFEAYKKKKNIP